MPNSSEHERFNTSEEYLDCVRQLGRNVFDDPKAEATPADDPMVKMTANAIENGDPDPGAGALPSPREDPLENFFHCPYDGSGLKTDFDSGYFVCTAQNHGPFDVKVGGLKIRIEQIQ